MALLLPALLDMVEEIYTNLDVKPDEGGVPFVFVPHNQKPGGCRRGFSFGSRPEFGQCRRERGRCPRGACPKGACPTACQNPEDFQINLNFKEFKLEDISVKTKDNNIIVEAKHDERSDEIGYAARHITRRFVLPDQYDPNTITSNMSNNGTLTIRASKPKESTSGERVIPVQRVEITEDQKPAENPDQENLSEKSSEPKAE
jgi:HSP20 family molecular chaperone IbpA